MTREQAIEVLINRYNSGVIRGRIDDEWRSATDTVIAALRDAQARQEGCEWCVSGKNGMMRSEILKDKDGFYVVFALLDDNCLVAISRTGKKMVDVKANYCYKCGRSLEPVGNADTLPTAEHSSGVDQEQE